MTGSQKKQCIQNSVAIVVFGMLAVMFRLWWISLFSLLYIIITDSTETDNKDKKG